MSGSDLFFAGLGTAVLLALVVLVVRSREAATLAESRRSLAAAKAEEDRRDRIEAEGRCEYLASEKQRLEREKSERETADKAAALEIRPDLVCPMANCGSVDFIAATPTVRCSDNKRGEVEVRKSGAMLRCCRCESLVSATPSGVMLVSRKEAAPDPRRDPRDPRNREDEAQPIGVPRIPSDMPFNRRTTP